MTKTSKPRAISIRGERHNPYSHVIFIMKEKEEPVLDFVAEAEKIINSGRGKRADIEESSGIKKIVIRESKASRFLLNASMFVASIGLVVGLFFILVYANF